LSFAIAKRASWRDGAMTIEYAQQRAINYVRTQVVQSLSADSVQYGRLFHYYPRYREVDSEKRRR